MLLIDEPLLPLLIAAAEGRLAQSTCRAQVRSWSVVIVSRGYPESSESGQPIKGVEAAGRSQASPSITREPPCVIAGS